MIFQNQSSYQQTHSNARPALQAAQAYTWQQTNSLMMNRWREKNSHSPNRRNGNGRNGQNGRNGRQNFPKDETFATNPADLEEDFNFEVKITGTNSIEHYLIPVSELKEIDDNFLN